MIEMLLQPEILRRVRVRGGDDVPARASTAEMWSSEANRRATWNGSSKDVDPVAIRPSFSVAMDSADSKRERLEGCRRRTALQRVHRHVQHRQVVGHEEGIEPRRLKPLGKLHDRPES